MRPSTVALALAFASLTLAPRALAQVDGPGNDESALTPPVLIYFVQAELTEEERPESTTRVVLDLVVDADGAVNEVTVVESGGALDARAIEAARRFRFEPARNAGVPVAVTIRYEYVFEAKPAERAAPPAANTVVNTAAGTVESAAPTSPAPPAPSANPDVIPEFEATAQIEAPRSEVTRRDLDAATIRRVAGTRGDVLKSIEILPGVARPSDGGDPILRGATAYESRTFLNGTPVPFLYHFGGLASFMSPYLVDRLELRPSNFSVRYGRVRGGIVEVRAADIPRDKFHGVIDASLIGRILS